MKFPSKCPYCGKDNVTNSKKSISELDKNQSHAGTIHISQRGYTLELHRCIHCKSPIFVLKEELLDNGTPVYSDIIHYYPSVTSVELPARIQLSPNACKTYEQTIKSKEQGFDMLVGAGLRIALEWLVWDYLIKVKGLQESDIENLKLYKRIELMSGNFYTEVCTRLIRLYGNDTVHIKKELDFSVDEVIEMFDLLCALIDSELQIKEVNNRLPPRNSN